MLVCLRTTDTGATLLPCLQSANELLFSKTSEFRCWDFCISISISPKKNSPLSMLGCFVPPGRSKLSWEIIHRHKKKMSRTPVKSVVLVAVIAHLAHFCPIILQPIIHRHKYKVEWFIYYIKSLSYRHLSGHMVKAEAENVKWRLPLKFRFDSLMHMPYNRLYDTIFFLQVSLTPATTKDR